jgi:hypothetical protein
LSRALAANSVPSCGTSAMRRRTSAGSAWSAARRRADRADLRIVEPLGELEDRRLARARRADDGDGLARLDGQAEVEDRRRVGPRRVAEGDVLEREPPRGGSGSATGRAGGAIPAFSAAAR